MDNLIHFPTAKTYRIVEKQEQIDLIHEVEEHFAQLIDEIPYWDVVVYFKKQDRFTDLKIIAIALGKEVNIYES